MTIKNDNAVSSAPDLARLACDIAGRAEALTAEIRSLYLDVQAIESEPVSRVRTRYNAVADYVRQAAAALLETAADLERITTTPRRCRVAWGVCPEHGNTLTTSGGKSWCRTVDCGRTWDYDRVSVPCFEPAGWTVADQSGGSSVMCHGHVYDAVKRIDGVRIALLDTEHRMESA
jgi:hypothetical protein